MTKNQPLNRSMPSDVRSDARADAEPDRNDRLGGLRLPQMVEDHKRIREEFPFSAGPAAARPITAVVEPNDTAIGEEHAAI